MILSSTSSYALLKEFSIACGFKYDAVFRVCLDNFCERCRCSFPRGAHYMFMSTDCTNPFPANITSEFHSFFSLTRN